MHWPYGEKTSCLGGVVYTEKDARQSMNGTYPWCGAALRSADPFKASVVKTAASSVFELKPVSSIGTKDERHTRLCSHALRPYLKIYL